MDYNSINKKILKLLQNNYSMYLQLFKEKNRNPLFYAGLRSYLPQHCLYFLSLPHAAHFSILYIHIVLCVFPLFSRDCGQVTYNIFCTNFAYFYIKYSPYVHKMCTNSSIFYFFFVIYIILQINNCSNSIL